jgi:hypothetical protein
MANNYNQFSTMIICSDEEAHWIYNKIAEYEGDEENDCLYVCSYEIEGSGIWLSADESFDGDALLEILCEFQNKFDYTSPIVITFADYCSQLRVDEFGGGALVIYQGQSYYMDAHAWADEKLKELKETVTGFYCIRRDHK